MSFRRINWAPLLTLSFLLIGSLVIGGGGLWRALSPITPCEELEEVRGQVSYCTIEHSAEGGRWVEARLVGDNRTFRFSGPDEKIDTVYLGLRVGGDVVLLVEEVWWLWSGKVHIWEGRSNGNVFLHYETIAEWESSNKPGNLGVGLGFLGVSGIFVWVFVWGMKKGWFK